MKDTFIFDVELKANAEEKGVIEGYASTFGNIDRHGDIIAEGAFKGGRTKVPIFGMHNPREGIGIGYVTEDSKGLFIKMKLAVDNQDSDILRDRAREYYAMAKEGIIERMSIGFATLEQDFEARKFSGKDRTIRIIKKVDLMEVSLVPIPANDKARVTSVKSLEDGELEELIQKAVEPYQKQMDELKAEIEALKNPEPNQEQTKKALSIDHLIMRKLGLF